jgi:hypothetical protein
MTYYPSPKFISADFVSRMSYGIGPQAIAQSGLTQQEFPQNRLR